MNYLKIVNKGLIEPEDITLVGSSTKRGDSSKIGEYGSGNKFALAWMMRNDCKPFLFRGKEEIKIDTEFVLHRDNPVEVITVGGEKTSITTHMGPKWKAWMSIRELVSNAIDEDPDYKLQSVWNPESFEGIEGSTVWYIPMNNDLATVLQSFDDYFSFERKPYFENSAGKLFYKTKESTLNIYRKGIRCYDSDKLSHIDFDFNDIDINESRVTSHGSYSIAITNFVAAGITPKVLKMLLQQQTVINSYTLPNKPNENLLECLKVLIEEGEELTCPAISELGGKFFTLNATLFIPNKWYKELQKEGLVRNVFESFNSNFNFIRTDNFDIKKLKYYLGNMNIKDVEIRAGKLDYTTTVENGVLYVNDACTMKQVLPDAVLNLVRSSSKLILTATEFDQEN